MKLIDKIKVPLKKEGFILGIGYNDSSQCFGCVGTDEMVHFYLQTSRGIHYYKGFDAKCIQAKIWYLEKHQIWITAGRDFTFRQWDLKKYEHLVYTFTVILFKDYIFRSILMKLWIWLS